MHSNWKVWDFISSNEKFFSIDKNPIKLIQTFSPFVLNILKSSIEKNLVIEGKLRFVFAKEITSQWFDDEFKSMSLFGNNDSYFIIGAQDLDPMIKQQIIEFKKLLLDSRVLILEFQKDDEIIKKLKDHESIDSVKIQAPAFWENEKLLSFLCDFHKTYLDYQAKQYIINKIEANVENYYNLLTQVKINFQDKINISEEDIASLIQTEKVDQFEFAALFANKKLKVFYTKFSKLVDFEELRSVSQFIQSHLLKVYDPSYTEEKKKLSQYDKEILGQSKIWKSDELARALQYFSKIEILAKSKNEIIFRQIKKDSLRILF